VNGRTTNNDKSAIQPFKESKNGEAMRKRTVAVCFLTLMFAVVVSAQNPSQMPTPGPEQKRLNYFAGTWNSEYEVKPGPMGPGGKMTETDRSQMLPGGFFLVTHTDGKTFMGDIHEVAVMGYDREGEVYTYDAYNSFGEAEHFKGTVQGDTWTWTSESRMGGQPVKMRFIAKEVSPTMYTMKLEMAGASGWTTVMEGKATKTK
jgi:hypothetical protein